MEHTRGKWIMGVACRIRDEHDNSIALCSGDASDFDWVENEANAEHICRCVNSHDELVAACENLIRGQMQHPTFEGYVKHAVWVAEQAIAKVEN